MGVFSKQNFKKATVTYVPMMFGLRVPGFLRMHLRYMRSHRLTWFVLVIVPFVFGAMSLSALSGLIFETPAPDLQVYLLALFLIALAFFFAERHRKFRRIYTVSIPVLLIANGLINLVFKNGFSVGNVIVFGLLSVLPAWWLGRHAMDKGYKLLSDGADNDYRPGRDLYMDGKFEAAFVHLEPSAKRGHMKSLYLMGHAHEHGNGQVQDRVKAARYYDKANRKGYGKARRAFETLLETFTADEREAFEIEVNVSGVNELF